jgi:hypothetical protein
MLFASFFIRKTNKQTMEGTHIIYIYIYIERERERERERESKWVCQPSSVYIMQTCRVITEVMDAWLKLINQLAYVSLCGDHL